ncbi:MAG: hypothetical protein MI717_04470 [Spirochaetales bacterium]|nr:hypothetical protein [Spirochaetales bacterium]
MANTNTVEVDHRSYGQLLQSMEVAPRVDSPDQGGYHGHMPRCAKCGASYEPPVYKTTVCSSCGWELKTCRNCRHFQIGAAHDCREPVSEPVLDKDRANFCDWFSPAQDASAQTEGDSSSQEAARQAFADLFGDD